MSALLDNSLQQELATYERQRLELIAAHLGQYVLVHGDSLRVFPTYAAALEAGYHDYGVDEPFMVDQIRAAQNVRIVSCHIAS